MIDVSYTRDSDICRLEIEEALDDAERSEAAPLKSSFDDLAQLFGVSDE